MDYWLICTIDPSLTLQPPLRHLGKLCAVDTIFIVFEDVVEVHVRPFLQKYYITTERNPSTVRSPLFPKVLLLLPQKRSCAERV